MDVLAEGTSERWVDRVRRPRAGAPRRLFEELSISLEAISEITKDTGQTRYAFEAIENFPVADVLRAWNGRLDWAALGYPGDPAVRGGRAAAGLLDVATRPGATR